nr:MAG TPA: hypothetical protein [Caudoviricetes sp.]
MLLYIVLKLWETVCSRLYSILGCRGNKVRLLATMILHHR